MRAVNFPPAPNIITTSAIFSTNSMKANEETYRSTASSNPQNSYMAFVDNATSWQSEPLYDSTGSYNGTAGVGSSGGEWVQLALPVPVVPLTFHVDGNAATVAVYGAFSNGSWTPISVVKFVNHSVIMNTSLSFSDFRVVITSVVPGNSTAIVKLQLDGFVKNQVVGTPVSNGTLWAAIGVSVGCTVIACGSLFVWSTSTRRKRAVFKSRGRISGNLVL